jgi:hypothetical protein
MKQRLHQSVLHYEDHQLDGQLAVGTWKIDLQVRQLVSPQVLLVFIAD